jgi:hypothetical protein
LLKVVELKLSLHKSIAQPRSSRGARSEGLPAHLGT